MALFTWMDTLADHNAAALGNWLQDAAAASRLPGSSDTVVSESDTPIDLTLLPSSTLSVTSVNNGPSSMAATFANGSLVTSGDITSELFATDCTIDVGGQVNNFSLTTCSLTAVSVNSGLDLNMTDSSVTFTGLASVNLNSIYMTGTGSFVAGGDLSIASIASDSTSGLVIEAGGNIATEGITATNFDTLTIRSLTGNLYLCGSSGGGDYGGSTIVLEAINGVVDWSTSAAIKAFTDINVTAVEVNMDGSLYNDNLYINMVQTITCSRYNPGYLVPGVGSNIVCDELSVWGWNGINVGSEAYLEVRKKITFYDASPPITQFSTPRPPMKWWLNLEFFLAIPTWVWLALTSPQRGYRSVQGKSA